MFKKMYKFCILLSVLAMAVSCMESKKNFDSVVDFEKIKIESNGKRDLDSVYNVAVTWDKPVDAPAYLNDSIMKYTKLLLAAWFNVADDRDFDASVANHMEEYSERVKKNNVKNHDVFDLQIDAEEIFQNRQIISFAYNWSINEGGAHGNYGKHCFVINKNDGSKISRNSLINRKKEEELLKLAEAEFKSLRGIKTTEKVSDAYAFENDKFHLSDEFHFTPSGLVFYYNPYDIAPYSAGLIELTLPYDKIRNYINWID